MRVFLYVYIYMYVCIYTTSMSYIIIATTWHPHPSPSLSQAHVCDAVQLDSGAMSSVNHWRAVAACVGWLTGRAGEDRRQEAMVG